MSSRLWSIGAPVSLVIGVRNALERRSGGANVPVGSALLGTVLAVTALCGTAVFGASLSHLTTTPKLYGDPFQLNISDPNSGGTPIPRCCGVLNMTVLLPQSPKESPFPPFRLTSRLSALSQARLFEASSSCRRLMGTFLMRSERSAWARRRCAKWVRALVRLLEVTLPSASGVGRTVPFRVVAQIRSLSSATR